MASRSRRGRTEMNNHLPYPLCIVRFKPTEILSFDPDAPTFINDPYPKECLATMDAVVRLSKELYEAEKSAWEEKASREIIETVIDGALRDILDVARYLERQNSSEAKSLHGSLMKLVVRMKKPLLACVLESIEAIYIKHGEKKAREAVEKLLAKTEGGAKCNTNMK